MRPFSQKYFLGLGRFSVVLLAGIFAMNGCTAKKDQQDEVVLDGEQGKPITTAEVFGEPTNTKAKKKKKRKLSKKKGKSSKSSSQKTVASSFGISAASRAQCLELISRIVEPYRDLYTKLDKNSYVSTNNPLDQMIQLTPAVCDNNASYNAATALMNAATGQHSGRIGIILPLTGKNNQLTTFMVKGMRAAFAENQQNFEQGSVVKDSTSRNAEMLLAELVFKDRVSAVIGGFENTDAQVLARWSEQLMLPVIITNHDRSVGIQSRYAFTLYPDEMRLAYTLVEEAERRNLKRIAILKPSNHKSDKLVEYFKQALSAKGGQVAFDLVYTPGNFDSMQAVSRTLFRIDAGERQDEYRAAYLRAKRNAKAQGAQFDPRMVVLKPIINFDAILLPDDFRTARHFAKLIKFHQVDKMTLIGNHEWRSPALVEPYDEFLEGSFFADFIGSYSKLPAAISAPTAGSPFFVQPQSVLAVDFQLIGYRAGRVGSIVANYKNDNRRQLPERIRSITSNNSSFFGDGLVFDQAKQSNWPTYVFGIANGGLQLEKEHTQLNLPTPTTPAEGKKAANSVSLSSSKSG